jgi:GNAT superfamily N-acetyltransferase
MADESGQADNHFSANPLSIRKILPSDAAVAARLSGELGYPVSIEVIEQRIIQLADCPHHSVYVACLDSMVVGWIDLAIAHHLQSDPYVEIGGLVVADKARSKGIGALLVSFAEEWAKTRGVRRVVVRSRISRERAHAFYERAGYTRSKTSAVFEKII